MSDFLQIHRNDYSNVSLLYIDIYTVSKLLRTLRHFET